MGPSLCSAGGLNADTRPIPSVGSSCGEGMNHLANIGAQAKLVSNCSSLLGRGIPPRNLRLQAAAGEVIPFQRDLALLVSIGS